MAKITRCISPAINGEKPIHAWIFGRPGTGKTLVSKHILKKMEKESHVKGVYINCWENSSYYSVLDKLVRIQRILGADKLNTSYKLERLKQFLGDKPFIIILDEIDKPNRHERDSIIYNNLCNTGKIGLVCICNSPFVLYSLDERIRSRLNAKQIEFNTYSKIGLVHILKQRAELALNPKSWSLKTIRKIAELAGGDARVAIQTLKNSALNAENDFSYGVIDINGCQNIPLSSTSGYIFTKIVLFLTEASQT
jgi:cell division control protein 6